MIRRTIKRLVLSSLLVSILACGGNETPSDFQQNQPVGFQLTEVTRGYGAVDDAYNSVDAHEFNVLLDRVVDGSLDEFETAQYATADILGDAEAPVAEIVHTEAAGLLDKLVKTSNQHHDNLGVGGFYSPDNDDYCDPLLGCPCTNAEDCVSSFYDFLDEVTANRPADLPDDYISGLINKVVKQMYVRMERSGEGQAWLNTEMDALMADLKRWTEIDADGNGDTVDIAKVLSKALIQTDYPVYLDADGVPCNKDEIASKGCTRLGGDDSDGMGNAVKGTYDLIHWANVLLNNPETHDLVYDMILGFNSILDPAQGQELADKVRALVENMEANFTKGGAVYKSNAIYSENTLDSEDGHEVYSDAELGQTIRESSTFLQQLFVSSDRPQSMIASKPGQAPVYPLDLMNENLRNIGFNPDTIDVEGSIDDLIRFDIWGRDRVNDPEAYPVSFLESLLFTSQVTANHGWQDAGSLGGNNPPQYQDSRVNHHQGAYSEELTLNDALFSIRMIRKSGTFGTYEMAFPETNGDHIYRTRAPFTLSQVNDLYDGGADDDSGDGTPDSDYRFFYTQNFGVLQFLAGPGVGDVGAPDGGNPDGQYLGPNGYRAYAPNGLHETQMAAWAMGWGVRACFGGEGPYYYAPSSPEMIDGYRVYYRPDGRRIYALLDGAGNYFYPAADGEEIDPESEQFTFNGVPQHQRANRFKSEWHSDYYIGHYSHDELAGRPPVVVSSENRYFTIDNSSGRTEIKPISDPNETAGRLAYRELIPEDEPMRACASSEEAFFRNFQWVMNEKKMVLVIPMYMENGGIKGMVFLVQECNGFSGLANLRRFRGNHVWAKLGSDGTDPSIGNSTIPGDYRFEVVSAPDDRQEGNLGAEVIYNDNIDGGNATPSVIGHNMPALYRLAFPLSSEMNRGNGIVDKILGSREFIARSADPTWSHRNALAPVLYSLLAGLREYTPAYDPDSRTAGVNSGMRAFLNQSATLIKPLFYFNRAEVGASGHKAPSNSWIPRIYGIYDTNGDGIDDRPTHEYFYVHPGAPFLTSSADFHAEYDEILLDSRSTPPNYFGDEAEQRFYQPAAMKTILNVMIDSDITDPQKRCNGLLPLITESNAKPLSRFFKLFLNPAVKAPPLEQIFTATKFTKGPMTEINATNPAKGMVFPEWMFATGQGADAYGAYTDYTGVRDEDIILDDILDFIIGHDTVDLAHEGYGLANFPDEQAAKPIGEQWKRFNDYVLTGADLLHESSEYCISQNILDLLDRLFEEREYTLNEVSGYMYSTGKLFGYYDDADPDPAQHRWVYQGQSGEFADIHNILAERMPEINALVVDNSALVAKYPTLQHRIEVDPLMVSASGGAANGYFPYGDHYNAQLAFLREASAEKGLLEYLLNTMSTPRGWEETLYWVDQFISENEDVTKARGRLWSELSQLLRDMGKAVGDTQEPGNSVGDVLTEYGFQVN